MAYRAAAVLLGSCFALLSGCVSAPAGPVAVGADSADLDEARRLMTERRCRSALALLGPLQGRQIDDPEIGYLIGECRYRTGDYPAAVAQFNALLDTHPDYYRAYARRWAALLARNRDARTRLLIASEIDALSTRRPGDPEALFAAYQGYALLRLAERRRSLILRLAARELDQSLRDAVVAGLLEEMIGARDAAQKRVLAALHVRRFTGTRGNRLAARHLVHLDRGQILSESDSVSVYRRRFPANRHLDQAIAAVLVEQGENLSLARSLLVRHIKSQSRARKRERPWYHSDAAFDTLFRWERAESEYLLGVIRNRQGRTGQAEHHLRRAAAAHLDPAKVYMALYDLLEPGAPDRAGEFLLRALVHGAPDPGREALWAQRIGASTPQSTDPRVELATRSGVPLFDDVTTTMGLEGVPSPRVAWGDFDNDGYDDLLLTGPRVLRNISGQRFEEATVLLGLDGSRGSTGGSWADVDNDGFLDLLLTYRDGDRLFRNDAGSRFRDVTGEAFPHGLAPEHTEASTWGDMDNDGWLDLYVAKYETGPERGTCAPDRLYRNRGDGTFADVTVEAGVALEEPLCGRGAGWLDIDGDSHQDILVANYRLDPNLLWVNLGDGRFEDRARQYAVRGRNTLGAFGHTIATAAGDVDGDGRTDLYLSNLAHPRYLDYSDLSTLWRNGAPHRVAIVPDPADGGIAFDETSAEPVLADLDNDGDLDLYITSVYRGRWSRLYGNNGSGHFSDMSWLSGARVENAWGTGVADFDNDGDPDLLVGSEQGVRLLRNRGSGGHWLQVRVRSAACNRFGVGARVRVRAGDSIQVREISAGRGTGSQDSNRANFGLGTYSGPVEVEVTDLCGYRASRAGVAPDQLLEIRLGP